MVIRRRMEEEELMYEIAVESINQFQQCFVKVTLSNCEKSETKY